MKLLAWQNFDQNRNANFGNLSKFEAKLFEQKTWANFQANKIWNSPPLKDSTQTNQNFFKTRNLILKTQTQLEQNLIFEKTQRFFPTGHTNGLRYLRWGGDGEAVQPEKCSGVENCLRLPQNPQRQVHALLGSIFTKLCSGFLKSFFHKHLIVEALENLEFQFCSLGNTALNMGQYKSILGSRKLN